MEKQAKATQEENKYNWPDNEHIVSMTNRVVMQTYGRFPIAIIRGRGCRLWDASGKVYLDFVAGLAVCNVGHCHPRVVAAIQQQAARLLHVSNLYHIPWQTELAGKIVGHSFGDRVFFCNSGAEANEAAIKLARRYEHCVRQGNRFEILTMRNSFHGRTLAAVTATGQEKFHKGFEPLVPGFRYVPFNDKEAVEKAVSQETCGILVEPIQGEGGVICPDDDYLQFLRRLCDEKELTLIFDEVQVGMGRTGTLFAYEQYGVIPDVMTLAKGLAGGVAIGAAVASERLAAAFVPGAHASTFGGNPLASAAGLAAMEVILDEGFLDNCRQVGTYLQEGLQKLALDHPGMIKAVRGKGLMQALELTVSGASLVTECLEQGLLINCTADRVLRFLPPLVVTREEIDEMLLILNGVLSKL